LLDAQVEFAVPDVLVYINNNHMEVINLKDGTTAIGVMPFTTHRLLVGELAVAAELLRKLLKEVKAGGLLAKPVRMLIQPLALVEGGLSSVEERVLLELGAAARARDVRIVLGGRIRREEALIMLEHRANRRLSAAR
jgi:rod shape-determining protein MreB